MDTESKITRVAECIIALEEPGPYTDKERESFIEAAKFFKVWGSQAFEMTEEEMQEQGYTHEDVEESAQPLLAMALELTRLASGQEPSVDRKHLVSHLEHFGRMAIEGVTQAMQEADAPSEPEPESDYDSGYGYY